MDFVIRLSKTCYKNSIIKSWDKSHAYLEKKAQQRKSPIGKVFDLNGDKYTFVAVKNTQNNTKENDIFCSKCLPNPLLVQ